MKIGIVISAGSKMVRRVVVPDSSNSELGFHPVSNGEQMLVMEQPSNFDIGMVPSLIQQMTGVTPPDSRCAVVSLANAVSGNVVNVIHADPAIDAPSPGQKLVLSPSAVPGWTWSSAAGLVNPNAVGSTA